MLTPSLLARILRREITTSSTLTALRTQLIKHGENVELEIEKNVERRMEELRRRPVITVPVHLEKRLERRMEKESTKWAERQKTIDASRIGKKSQILIQCKRQDFNYYLGQSYDKRKEVPLASVNWRHKRSRGDFFTIFPGTNKKSPYHMSGAEATTFEDLGVSSALCENLKQMGIETPTHIQVFGLPHILKGPGSRTVVAAETGCGKTLVYLLPIFTQILENKRYRVRQKPGHPTAVILAPSRELADQIFSVAVSLAQGLDITVKLLQGGNMSSKLSNPPQTKEVDIVVATANALKVLSSKGVYGTSRILHVVLDEADTLLDDSFFPDLVAPFLQLLPWSDVQREIQLTMVSATLPKGINATLGEIMKTDDFYFCMTPGLHYILPHVPQTFLRVRKMDKPEKLKEILMPLKEKNIPTMIFCNKSATCSWMSHYLNDEGIECAAVHGRMPMLYRRGRIEMYQRGEINMLISTDLASRGIDTVRTQHVINYEFPLFMADYIHRCGRTGRVGSSGGCRVTNLISRPGEVATVNEIERSVRKETKLPDVNANIKSLYTQHYGAFEEIHPVNDDDEQPRSKYDAHHDESDSESRNENQRLY